MVLEYHKSNGCLSITDQAVGSRLLEWGTLLDGEVIVCCCPSLFYVFDAAWKSAPGAICQI